MNSKANPARIALVGCGAIAEIYHLPALAKFPSVMERLVLVDPNEARLKQMAEKFGVRETATDYRKLLGGVDGAILAVPHHLHRSITLAFLSHQVPVLCEKPLAESVADAKEMIEEARKQGVALAVNHVRRMFPSYIKIKELISTGAIGKLKSLDYVDGIVFRWPTSSGFYFQKDRPMGVLFDRGVHSVDAVCWWLGGKPELKSFETDSFGGVEGNVIVKAGYDGCEVRLALSWLNKLQNVYKIIGETGTIEGVFNDWETVTITRDGKKEIIKLEAKVKDYMEFGTDLIGNFIDVTRGEADPLVPASDVLDSLELIEDCYRHPSPLAMPWYEIHPAQTVGEQVSALEAEGSVTGPGVSPQVASSHEHPQKVQDLGVLVTGAAGFVGGWMVEGFYLRGISNIRAGIHQWGNGARPARFPVTLTPCDILDKAQAREAVRGVDVIVHCAVGLREVVVDGTRNLLEAALEEGVKRFIHISTAEVYGNRAGKIAEDMPLEGRTDYAVNKADAERLCMEFSARGLPVTILRPSIIYGPFGNAWTVKYADKLKSGNWGIYEEYGNGFCNLVYADDLVQAAYLAMTDERAVGEAFNVKGPDTVTWNEYFERLNSTLGLPPLRHITRQSAGTRSAFMDVLKSIQRFFMTRWGRTIMNLYMRSGPAKKTLKKMKDTMDITPTQRDLQELFNRKAVYENAKAETLLGYHPQYTLDKGLELSVAWLTQNGFEKPTG